LLKGELYKVYEKSNQHLLPKETYSQTCVDLKTADQQKKKQIIEHLVSEDGLLRALSVPRNAVSPFTIPDNYH